MRYLVLLITAMVFGIAEYFYLPLISCPVAYQIIGFILATGFIYLVVLKWYSILLLPLWMGFQDLFYWITANWNVLMSENNWRDKWGWFGQSLQLEVFNIPMHYWFGLVGVICFIAIYLLVETNWAESKEEKKK